MLALGDDAAGGLDAVHPGHPHVHQHHVRVLGLHQPQRGGAVAGLADHRHVVLGVKDQAEAQPQHGLVVGEQDRDGHAPSAAVPVPVPSALAAASPPAGAGSGRAAARYAPASRRRAAARRTPARRRWRPVPACRRCRGRPRAGRPVPRPRGRRRPAVVGHLQLDLAGPVGHADLGGGAGSVLEGVGQRLLGDAVERELGAGRQRERRPGHGQPRRQSGRPHGGDQLLDVIQAGLRGVPGLGRLAQHAHQPAHLGQGRTPGGRHLAHERDRLARAGPGGVGGAVGERDHHGDIVRHDVVHLPRDPGPFGRGGELRLLVPLIPQPLGLVSQGLEGCAPGADVVAEQPGRRVQGAQGQDPEHPHPVLNAGPGEGQQHRADGQRRGGEHNAPRRLVRGDRVERHEQEVAIHAGGIRLHDNQYENEPEDPEGVKAPGHQQNRLGGEQAQRQDMDPAGWRNGLWHRQDQHRGGQGGVAEQRAAAGHGYQPVPARPHVPRQEVLRARGGARRAGHRGSEANPAPCVSHMAGHACRRM